ncbi:Crp/Fnr family transcriptional regulator [Sphingomonas spermidinifaciens]|uniref:Crp/Fnr family transcriptional regulator n=1 Tax=Sphingomonas spermidinifaciens TaxID=1141889 RepID=UPI001FE82A82|nr:Crp/Fnr family transcriptional regulator [Sphingomonas spermidinifaciens]
MRARSVLSREEEEAIRSSVARIEDYPADRIVVPSHRSLDHSTLLLDGIMCRSKALLNGERQITELHVAGDFADLHSFTLKYLDHEVLTLTRCRAAIVPHEALRAITERFPGLARIYWFATNLDAAIQREWAVSLGRRPARARLAALFCELQVRLEIVGLTEGPYFDLPLTQTDLAECMGLTNVHVNRTLRDLKQEGLLAFRSGRAHVIDRDRLRSVAEFDPAYLYLGREAR